MAQPSSQHSTHSSAPRSAALIYALALGLLAALAVLSHIVMERVIAREQAATVTIRMAGRQRMLSQRILRVAVELADGSLPPEVGRPLLLDLANTMLDNQRHLLYGDPAEGILPPTSPALRDLYLGPEDHLAGSVAAFLSHARRFALAPDPTQRHNPDLAAMRTAASGPLLDVLDRALQQYMEDGEGAVASMQRLMNLLTAAMLLTLTLEAIFVYRPLFLKMSRAISALSEASLTDALTGLLNRRALLQAAERDLAHMREERCPLCVVMADLDYFKQINDRFGHATGDRILKEFALCLEDCLRRGDRAGRIGGEEFAIILPQSGIGGGRLVAERIRECFAERAAALLPRGATLFPTVSMGIVAAEGDASVATLLAQADGLLYNAKAAGRNRVVAPEPSRPAQEASRLRLADERA